MTIQQINPKCVSITQIRRDIDVLNQVLVQEKEAFVVKNQQLLFIAVSPEKYKTFSKEVKNRHTIEQAIASINQIRKTSKTKPPSVSRYVIKMRDERVKKWKK